MRDINEIINQVIHGDCLEVLKEIPDNSIDAVVTDPPYGLSEHDERTIKEVFSKWLSGEDNYIPNKKGFMGKNWDAFVPPPALWKEVYRVMKPGAHILVFAGTRTLDLMSMSLRLAGFEIRDTIMWIFGSSLPKGINISKSIDALLKEGKTSPKVINKSELSKDTGKKVVKIQPNCGIMGEKREVYKNIGAELETDEAKKWSGWNTTLKTSYEPIICAAKRLIDNENFNIISDISNNLGGLLWQLLVGLEKMDMSNSQGTVLIVLNTVLLWKIILEELLKKENISIILTESKVITELKILNFLLLKSIQKNTNTEEIQINGLNLFVKIAEKNLIDEKLNIEDILNLIAQEIVIYRQNRNGIDVENVEENLLPIILNANSVLINVLTDLIIDTNRNELSIFVDFAEKNLKQYLAEPQNIVVKDVWQKHLKNIRLGLKPVILARKPIEEGNVASNVLKWGTGGINIDKCRIGNEKIMTHHAPKGTFAGGKINRGSDKNYYFNKGRFPSNTILECTCDKVIEGKEIGHNSEYNFEESNNDNPVNITKNIKSGIHYKDKQIIHTDPNCPAYMLDKQSGITKSTGGRIGSKGSLIFNMSGKNYRKGDPGFGDIGGASRFFKRITFEPEDYLPFFYCSKASKKERNQGLAKQQNIHPTVKPIRLCEYLETLITPQDGIVLDPFAGSGSTLIACKRLGIKYIGIELSEEYIDIAKRRLEAVKVGMGGNNNKNMKKLKQKVDKSGQDNKETDNKDNSNGELQQLDLFRK
jgi:DNA modification methylase